MCRMVVSGEVEGPTPFTVCGVGTGAGLAVSPSGAILLGLVNSLHPGDQVQCGSHSRFWVWFWGFYCRGREPGVLAVVQVPLPVESAREEGAVLSQKYQFRQTPDPRFAPRPGCGFLPALKDTEAQSLTDTGDPQGLREGAESAVCVLGLKIPWNMR